MAQEIGTLEVFTPDTTAESAKVNSNFDDIKTASNTHFVATSGEHGVDGTFVGTSDTQTLTNKSLTSPAITGAGLGKGTLTYENSSSNTTQTIPAITGTYGLNVQIQDFTTIGSIGGTTQQHAGHIWTYTDLDSKLSNFATLAYYKFASGALTTDDLATYTLTNNNAATNTTGILNTNFATDVDGTNQYYSQGTLLDVTSTLSNGLFIGLWFKADDGQPAAQEYIFDKTNNAGGGTEEIIRLTISTAGVATLEAYAGGSSVGFPFLYLPNSTTGWHFFCVNWDTTNGIRVWCDGVLCGSNAAATTIMADGTAADFIIGALNTPASYFNGKLAQFIVADAVVTQRDIDWMFASTLAEPTAINGKEYLVVSSTQPEADTNYIRQDFTDVVAKYNNLIYLKGKQFGSTDKVKHIAKTGV